MGVKGARAGEEGELHATSDCMKQLMRQLKRQETFEICIKPAANKFTVNVKPNHEQQQQRRRQQQQQRY